MFEAHAGARGPERPVDAGLSRVVGLRPRGVLRTARGQGLPRQDAQFRFGPVEPTAVRGVNTRCTHRARRRASSGGKARSKET